MRFDREFKWHTTNINGVKTSTLYRKRETRGHYGSNKYQTFTEREVICAGMIVRTCTCAYVDMCIYLSHLCMQKILSRSLNITTRTSLG
jgi:hypothetical protein